MFNDILDVLVTVPGVRISFDDGNDSDAQSAAPALLERELAGTFYVLAGRLGSAGSVSRRDLSALLAAGFSIGTHGMHHLPWKKLGAAAVEREMVTARRELEDITGRAITSAATPFGRYDRASLASLRRFGYSEVCTSDRRLAVPGSFLQHRFSVTSTDTPDSVLRAIVAAGQPHYRLAKVSIGLAKRWLA
ncbi:peptidoglycan/xylan/chitin deacetylase (PgdA/CDA1 family) [Phycicoccus badiiscoriae]|uniref:Peptidoglycan/xylan/chitin deacetylase (PgdA/CDA1 family) n=1 Tax=Pedococcus badiiscoriae TaxID=642776 RepID=A0A852WKW3_9MICO|nr:peptidoglycan/xylan/chitin deacetylase (PgdA/CDA1 family) [Pedococcus badiiscoriae]